MYDDVDAKQKAASSLGQIVRVYLRPSVTSPAEKPSTSASQPRADDEGDDFYEFTLADYVRLKQSHNVEKHLKTREMREQEEAAHRARITKAVIRVQFPDGWILEANFQPGDTIADLYSLLKQAIVHPHLPFYLFSTPPKRRLSNMAQSLYDAGLAPGALIYFSHEATAEPVFENLGEGGLCRYLLKNVAALQGAPRQEVISSTGPEQDDANSQREVSKDVVPQPVVALRKASGKPKWFKG